MKKRDIIKFVKSYDVTANVTQEKIAEVAQALGYSVYYYYPDSTDGKTAKILQNLRLSDYASTVDAFTCTLDAQGLLFVRSGLAREDTVFLLLHEIGHIVCEHKAQNHLFYHGVKNEREANNFAEAILSVTSANKSRAKIAKVSKTVCAALLFASIAVIAIVNKPAPAISPAMPIHAPAPQESPALQTAPGDFEVYVFPSGKRYHLESCSEVTGRSTGRQTTLAEARKDYTPCSKCHPPILE